MANDDVVAARGGLLPVEYPFGNYKKGYYRLTTGAAAANIYLGMPVDLDANGRAAVVEVTASNNALLGSVVGFLDTDFNALPTSQETTTAAPYLPGNTDAIVIVADDPQQDFIIQEDTGGTALALADIGLNANLVYRSSSGNNTTGYTTCELDASSAGTGTGGVLMVKNLAFQMNSDGTRNAVGDYAKWIVRIVRHRWSPMSTGPTGTQI